MNILYIMSVYNIYGGTPKKTLDLLRHSENNTYLYMYEKGYQEFKYLFEETGVTIIEGYFGRNLFYHIKLLLAIIDKYNIEIVQTQFSMGETLGYLIKVFRPHVKLIVAFVAPFEPSFFKKHIVSVVYKKVDAFVYISEYVKKYKTKQFPVLAGKYSKIIFNGTEKRKVTTDNFPTMKHFSLYTTSGLTDWKNINVLLEAMKILKEQNFDQIFLYVAGDGPERDNLELKIKEYSLGEHVNLLGYQKNIGALLKNSDVYVHPAYSEGFGIAITEAMMAEKPIIVSDAGALPELIQHKQSGLIVDPFDSNAWADAIITLFKDRKFAKKLGKSAKSRVEKEFSIEKYVDNYKQLYEFLRSKK